MASPDSDSHLDPSTETTSTAAPVERPSNASSVRLIVLLVLLAIFGGALGYDRLVARPGSEGAEAKLTALVEQRSESGGQLERQEVIEAVGQQPADYQNIEGNPYKMDVFQWRAGAPWRSYTLYVVYTGIGDQLFYHTHFMNEEPPAELRPDYEVPIPAPTGPPEDPVVPSAGENSTTTDQNEEVADPE